MLTKAVMLRAHVL